MGTVTPPPPVIGDTCANCDGVLWPAGATPKFIHLKGIDIEPCPAADYEAPNDIFVLEQVAGRPCEWSYDVPPYWWYIEVGPLGAVQGMMKRDAGGMLWTFLADWHNCDSDYDNTIVACDGKACKNGRVEITWS